MSFISPKAIVQGHTEGNVTILGSTFIGRETIIGKDVIVGYPARNALKSLTITEPFNIWRYDEISRGVKIGEKCIIRSGTVIYEGVTIADSVETGHNVLIREDSSIGKGTLIGSSTILDGAVKIGENVSIQSNVYLPHLTVIEDDVFIAPNVCFTNDPYPKSKHLLGATVKKNSILGANATIIAGVKIGENAVIGAGTVVTKDIPPGTVVVGNPARFHMTRREFEEKKRAWEELSTR